MGNTQKIEELLKEIRRLEDLVKGMEHAEIYPVSFFSRTFDLTHQILLDLHQIESIQIESLRKQMEEHQARLLSIPVPSPQSQPEIREERPVKEEPFRYPAEKLEQIGVMPEIITEPSSVEPAIEEKKSEETPETELQSEEVTPAPIPEKVEEKEQGSSLKPGVCLSDALEKKNLTDFRKAFSLNDRFYFLRELFSGQETHMNRAISDLDSFHTLEESMTYLTEQLNWDPENEHVIRFIQLLEKRFL